VSNTCRIIDISSPQDGNIDRKLAEKLAKYSYLQLKLNCVSMLILGFSCGLGSILGNVHAGIVGDWI
jgi:hypothetical protein